MTSPETSAKARRDTRKQFADRLSLLAGGLALIWLGGALGLGAGTGAALLGAGLILGAEQIARVVYGLRADTTWSVGAAFGVIAGLLMLAGVAVPVGALILVALGILVVGAALRRRG